jgi:molecular chaperone DnaJ
MTLTLEDIYMGKPLNVEVDRYEKCQACSGSGAEAGSAPITCPQCGGRGQVRIERRTGMWMSVQVIPCSRCGGRGKLIEKPCHICRGRGIARKKQTVEITLPPGIEDGDRLRVPGLGNAGESGAPPGDLYVEIAIKKHPTFRRMGNDVLLETTVSMSQAALGHSIRVPTLGGDTVELKVPPGTQPETLLRLKGKGLPSSKSSRGDELIRVHVTVPTKMTDKQKRLLAEFENESRGGLFRLLKRTGNAPKLM